MPTTIAQEPPQPVTDVEIAFTSQTKNATMAHRQFKTAVLTLALSLPTGPALMTVPTSLSVRSQCAIME